MHSLVSVYTTMHEHRLIKMSTGRCYLRRQLWSPRCAHGYGPNRPRSFQQVHEVQPKEPTLGQPRPFCPLVRLPLFVSKRISRFKSRRKTSCGNWCQIRKRQSSEKPLSKTPKLHAALIRLSHHLLTNFIATVTDACSNMLYSTCTATPSALTTSRSSV